MKIVRLDVQARDVLRAQLAGLLRDAAPGSRVVYANTLSTPEAA